MCAVTFWVPHEWHYFCRWYSFALDWESKLCQPKFSYLVHIQICLYCRSTIFEVMIFVKTVPKFVPSELNVILHDGVIKWKQFPRHWPFVRGIHRSPVISPHKGQWRGALMFSLICAWVNAWVNNCGAGDLRRHRAHYDAIVMIVESTVRLRLYI